MSLDTTKPSPAPDAVAYYRCHGPEKNIARVGLTAWRSVLLEMIEDNLTLDEIHTWMTEHHKALHFQLPAKTTVRDWLTRVRQEIGKPLRQRVKSPEPAIPPPRPEAPAAPPTKFPTAATTAGTTPSKTQNPDSDPQMISAPISEPVAAAKMDSAPPAHQKTKTPDSNTDFAKSARPTPRAKKVTAADKGKSASPGTPVEAMTSVQINNAIRNIEVDKNYPERILPLKMRQFELEKKHEAPRSYIQSLYSGIGRDMHDAGFEWTPPSE